MIPATGLAFLFGTVVIAQAQPFNAQTTKYPYYGKYLGRLVNPDYGLDGIVWIASETQIQVTDFSFVPPLFRRPNASFWIGPAEATDNPRADAYPSNNGLYIEPLVMQNDAPLLNVFRQPKVQIARRPTAEQIASIVIGNSGESRENSVGEPIGEPIADASHEADHGPVPEPEPGAPLPTAAKAKPEANPRFAGKSAEFGNGEASAEEPTAKKTITSTHVRFSPRRPATSSGSGLDQSWSRLVNQYPNVEPGPVDTAASETNRQREFQNSQKERTIIEEVPIRGRRSAEQTVNRQRRDTNLADFLQKAMILGSSAVSSQLDVRASTQEGRQQKEESKPAKTEANPEPGPLDLLANKKDIPIQRCPFPIRSNDTDERLIRIKHATDLSAGCADGPVMTVKKEDEMQQPGTATIGESAHAEPTGAEIQENVDAEAKKTEQEFHQIFRPMKPLHATLRQHFVLNLPEGKKVQDYRWLSLFDHSSKVALSAVTLPSSRRSSMPKPIMLKGFKPALSKRVNSTGIEIVDMKTIRVKNFFFEGDAPGAWFSVSRSIMPGLGGRLVPILNDDGTFDCDFLQPYDGTKDVTLKLPGDMDVRDVFNLSVYCVPYSISFAHVYLPYKDLVVPPDMSQVEVPYCVYE